MLEKSITKHDEIITVLKNLYTSFNKVQIKAYLPLEQDEKNKSKKFLTKK